MKSITSDIHKKVQVWNRYSKQINPSLFLADSYEPKQIPINAGQEVVFWYDVTNLYALFADCMPYLYRVGERFNRTNIKLNNSKSLFDILRFNNLLAERDEKKIKQYIDAIKELRSCFCHNKCFNTLNVSKINMGMGMHSQKWGLFPHLGCSEAFNYNEANEILRMKTAEMISIIDTFMCLVINNADDKLITEWSKSIVTWYLSSNDIIYRGLITYVNSRKKGTVYGGFQKMTIDSLVALAQYQKKPVEKLIQEIQEEILEFTYYSSSVASPENILYILFDRII